MIDLISHKCPQRQAEGNERDLSCAFLARSTQNTPDCLAGHAIMSGNLAKGFMILTDAAHHVRPFFSWDGTVRLTWTWKLLRGYERGNTAKHLLECEQSLKELAIRLYKMN
jgi:hypothetical protein